jgi:hypothetical protein
VAGGETGPPCCYRSPRNLWCMSQMIGVIYTMAYDMGDLELDNSWHVSFAEVYK